MKRADRCPYCGAPIAPPRLSLREMVAVAICGALLLVVAAPSGRSADQLVERQRGQMLDRAVWHEPLDDWNR